MRSEDLDQLVIVIGGALSIASVGMATLPTRLWNARSKILRWLPASTFVSGLTLEFFGVFQIEGIPKISSVNSLVSIDTVVLSILLLLASTLVVAVGSMTPLQSSTLRRSAGVLSALGLLGLAGRLVTSDTSVSASTVARLEITTLIGAVLILTAAMWGRRVSSLIATRSKEFHLSRSWRGAAFGPALVAILTMVSFAGALRSQIYGLMATQTSSSALSLQHQSRSGGSSDSSFASGILPNRGDGTTVPTVLAFQGLTVVGNPNMHQVLRLRLQGALDKGRIGAINIVANGVPQPDGFLNLTGSRAMVHLYAHHRVGVGTLNLVSARVMRGTLAFSRSLHYDFILTTNPTSYNHLQGRLTLISLENDSGDKDTTGLA